MRLIDTFRFNSFLEVECFLEKIITISTFVEKECLKFDELVSDVYLFYGRYHSN